jgi:hypothetical protein
MRPAVRAIIAEVGKSFGGLTVEEIVSKNRQRTIALARMVSVYVARAEFGLSYPELGREFGGRDHTTMINAVSTVAEFITKNDPQILAALDAGERAAEECRTMPSSMVNPILDVRNREFRQPTRPLAKVDVDASREHLGAPETEEPSDVRNVNGQPYLDAAEASER